MFPATWWCARSALAVKLLISAAGSQSAPGLTRLVALELAELGLALELWPSPAPVQSWQGPVSNVCKVSVQCSADTSCVLWPAVLLLRREKKSTCCKMLYIHIPHTHTHIYLTKKKIRDSSATYMEIGINFHHELNWSWSIERNRKRMTSTINMLNPWTFSRTILRESK